MDPQRVVKALQESFAEEFGHQADQHYEECKQHYDVITKFDDNDNDNDNEEAIPNREIQYINDLRKTVREDRERIDREIAKRRLEIENGYRAMFSKTIYLPAYTLTCLMRRIILSQTVTCYITT